MSKQFNTLNQLRTFVTREQMAYHMQADRMVSFKVVNPGFTTGFGSPSDKCLLREARRRGWAMGPALKKKATEAAVSW